MVAERYAGPGDRINDNKIVKLAQIDPLVGQGGRARRPVRPDQADAGAQVTVNAAISDKRAAKVWRIDRVMDAASGTFTVLLKVENKGNAIPAGIRCSIRF